MPQPVKFEAKVINVQVKSKTVKEKTEDGPLLGMTQPGPADTRPLLTRVRSRLYDVREELIRLENPRLDNAIFELSYAVGQLTAEPANGGSRRDGPLGLPHEPVLQTDPHVDDLRELVDPIRPLTLPTTLRARACVECQQAIGAGVVVGLAIFCLDCAEAIGAAARDARVDAEARRYCEHHVEEPLMGQAYKNVWLWDEQSRCLLCGGKRCDQCDGTGIFDRSDEEHELREPCYACARSGVWP